MRKTEVPAGCIAVGVDGSDDGRRALVWAAGQAAAEQRPLALVHGIAPLAVSGSWMDPAHLDNAGIREAVVDAGADLLQRLERSLATDHPDLVVTTHLCHQDPREALLAASQVAALVVVGSRGRGPMASLVLGSVSVAVAKHAACPVVVLRPTDGTAGHGVLVGVEGTQDERPALELAFHLASVRGLPLTVLHSFWDVAAASGELLVQSSDPDVVNQRLMVAEATAGFVEKYPDVRVTVELKRGMSDLCLVRAADSHELVVVGWTPDGLLRGRVRASVALAVLEHARSGVALVPLP